jgi:hypothetical protein
MLSRSCGSLTEHYRGIPQGDSTAQNNAYREHAEQPGDDHALEQRRRNPFADCLAGEKPPYSYKVFTRVYDKLNALMGDYPQQDWYWTRLDREDKDDMNMVFYGFSTVAYDRLGAGRKASVKRDLYDQIRGKGYSFTPNHRFHNDRFELTYRQAQIVQKTMRYLDVDYDPGGEENTPENLAKRTFFYDDYLARPIPPDEPHHVLRMNSQRLEEIAEYVRSKKK